MLDVLFITRLGDPTDAGSEDLFRDLRLRIEGRTADIPVLRQHVGVNDTVSGRPNKFDRSFPVLTSYYFAEGGSSPDGSVTTKTCSGWTLANSTDFPADYGRMASAGSPWIVQSGGGANCGLSNYHVLCLAYGGGL